MFRKINDKIDNFTEDLESPLFLKKHMKTLGLKNTITEIKNSAVLTADSI